MDIKYYQGLLENFAVERNWNQFHTPKNLVMALSNEVGELMELFQWLTPEQSLMIKKSNSEKKMIEEEVADVFIYLLRLTDKLGINIEDCIKRKIELNKKKYPVELSKDNATKYNKRKKD